MKTSYGGETHIYTNGLGHVTKMVAMPYGKKTLNNLLLYNQYTVLGMWGLRIGDVGPTKFIQMMVLVMYFNMNNLEKLSFQLPLKPKSLYLLEMVNLIRQLL